MAPTWTPRFLCYRNADELPRVGLAVLAAEAFLIWPTRLWARKNPLPLFAPP